MMKFFYYIFTICVAFQLNCNVVAMDELGLDPESEVVDTIEPNSQTKQRDIKKYNKKVRKSAKRKIIRSHKTKKRHLRKKRK